MVFILISSFYGMKVHQKDLLINFGTARFGKFGCRLCRCSVRFFVGPFRVVHSIIMS